MSDEQIKVRLSLDPGNTEAAAARAEAAIGRIGTTGQASVAQTAAAMRSLPAQFTDIATQLQGGQSPLTVLFQQGGQIKDQFGSVGAAVRGVGGYVAGLVTPVTALAAAGGVFALAYAKGAEESDRFAKSLILSGNAAGTTVGRLQDAAQRVAAVVGTQGQAAAALAELAGAANISPVGLEKFAEAAVRMERATGQSVADTVKAFTALGERPLEATLQLDKGMNYLSLSTYKQIKALEEAGKTAEAAKIAQNEYANAGIQRSKELEDRLGSLEKAWAGVKKVAASAWDAMLNVGREDTLDEKLKAAQAKLTELEQQRDNGGTRGGRRRSTFDLQIQDQQASIEALREQQRLQDKMAVRAAQAVQDKRNATAWDELAAKYASDEVKEVLEIKRAREAGLAAKAKEAEIEGVIAGIRAKFRKGSEADPFAADREAAKEWASAVQGFSKAADDARAKLDELTPSQAALVRYLTSPGYQNASEPMRQLALQQAYAAIGAEQLNIAEKARAKIAEEASKAYKDQIDSINKAIESLNAKAQATEDENAAVQLSTQSNLTLAQALAKVEIARLRERQAASLGNEEVVLAIEREIQARERLLKAMDTKQQREAGDKLRAAELAEWQKIWDQVGQSLTDALFEGGKKGSEYLKSLFRTMVLRPLVQPVITGMAATLGMPTGAAASVGSSGGGAGGGMGGLGGLGQLAGLAGYGSIFKSGAQLAMNGGTGVGLEGSLAMLQGGQYGAGLAQGAGVIAPYAMAAVIGTQIGRGISQDRGLFGGSGNATVNAGAAIGAVFGGPVGAAIGAAAGGLVNNLFGSGKKKVTDFGLSGTLGGSGDGVDVQAFEAWKKSNGIFAGGSSKGTRLSAADGGAIVAISQAVTASQAATRAYAQALGLGADSVDNYTQQIKVSLKGLNDQQRAEAINKAIAGFADGLASTLGAKLDTLASPGETASQTLARLATSLTGVNSVLDSLNVSLLATSTAGADAASKLIAAFGNVDTYTTLASTYLQDFYTASERSRITTRQLTEQLGKLGLTLPTSRDGFRQLVEAQDLTTDQGRKTYAALLGLSQAFASITEAAQLSVTGITSEIQRLRDANDSSGARGQSIAALQARFASTTAQARSGSQQALDALPGLSKAIEESASATARSAADVAALRAWLATSLSDTLAAVGAALPAQAQALSQGGTVAASGSSTGAGNAMATGSAASQGDGVLRELQALRADLGQLRSEQQVQALQLATNTGKLYRLMDQVSSGGNAINTRVVT